jgi:putative hydrolase of the HAD superfamily
MTGRGVTARVDAFLFDAGGVLVLPDPTVLGPTLVPYGGSTDLEAHRRAHYAGMATKSEQGAEEKDWRAYDRTYVQAVGVADGDADEAALVLGRTRSPWLWRYPVASSVEALRALHDRGVPIGVVSNAAGQIEAVLRRMHVCQLGEGDGVPMRCIVDSHVVGVAKPDPHVFDSALEILGLLPERIAYIGDSVTMDIGGARAAGLLPVLIDPFDDHAGADFERVKDLGELLAWI